MIELVDVIKSNGPTKNDIKLLENAKREESIFIKKEKLTKIKIRGGYVMTTEPDIYDKLKTN